jgi:flagellar protein FliO/FliZ
MGSSVFSLLIRLVISLAVVIGLMMVLAGVLRRRGVVVAGPKGSSRAAAPAEIEILGRKGLGRNAQIAVVRAAGSTYVLGITEQHITLLGEGELPATPEAVDLDSTEDRRTGSSSTAPGGAVTAWTTMLESMRDRTVRRS